MGFSLFSTAHDYLLVVNPIVLYAGALRTLHAPLLQISKSALHQQNVCTVALCDHYGDIPHNGVSFVDPQQRLKRLVGMYKVSTSYISNV